MARILILIGGHLWTSPRSQKEAAAWADGGHDVTIGGVWLEPRGAERDLLLSERQTWRFAPIVDLRDTHAPGLLRNRSVRLGYRLAREVYAFTGVVLPALFGYGVTALLHAALEHRADLTIVHSEAGLWVGEQLLKRGQQVGVDFEDWFSEDLLPEARRQRPIARIRELESRLARECPYVLTTSRAMSDAMSAAYSCRPPTVVYNTFSDTASQVDGKVKDRRDCGIPSLHWFSQNIGPGRGLEVLFRALAILEQPFECHLRGAISRDSMNWLDGQLSPAVRRHVFTHDTVPTDQLLSRIAEHDVGLALETMRIRSRDLTITNKVFQYLQAGLAVIATATTGQQEVLRESPDAGFLIEEGDPNALAECLGALLRERDLLTRRKAAARRAFAQQWAWERQLEGLQAAIAAAVA